MKEAVATQLEINVEDLDKTVKAFKDMFNKGMGLVIDACRLYVTAIDASAEARLKFREGCPDVPECTWARIELVGRGIMHSRLLWETGPGAKKVRKLPFSQQKICLEEGIEVLLDGGDTMKMQLTALTNFQVDQVFTKDHVRTLAEQKAWLESYKSEYKFDAPVAGELESYLLKDKKLIVLEPMTFSKRQLKKILEQL